MENVLRCKICKLCFNSDYKKPTIIECGHTFCKICISKAESNKCPICKTGVDLNNIITNYIVEEMIQALRETRNSGGINKFNLNGYLRQQSMYY
jgi:hypothetical protein